MAALQRAHGHVQTDTDGHGSFIDFDRVEVRDVDLKPLADLPFVTRMKFDYAPIGDEGLVFFKNLQSLRELSLRGTKITDAGLVNLQNLPSLTELDLERTGITNAGLEALGPIKSLRRVYVGPRWPNDGGWDRRTQGPKSTGEYLEEVTRSRISDSTMTPPQHTLRCSPVQPHL